MENKKLKTKVIRGLQTGWYQCGNQNGPIILFLHGFPDSPDTWSFQVEHFQKEYLCVLPYTRGAEPSSKPEKQSRYGIHSTALDQLAIIKEIDPKGEKKIVLVGHDMGTPSAWQLSSLVSERLIGLIVLNGLTTKQMAQRLKNPRQLIKSWYMFVFMVPKAFDTAAKYFPKRFINYAHDKGGLSQDLRPSSPMPFDFVINPVKQYRALALALPKALREKTPRLKNPVLVMFGNNDAFLEMPTKGELSAVAEDFEIRILEGNHWIHREQHQMVNELMEEFICQSKNS